MHLSPGTLVCKLQSGLEGCASGKQVKKPADVAKQGSFSRCVQVGAQQSMEGFPAPVSSTKGGIGALLVRRGQGKATKVE